TFGRGVAVGALRNERAKAHRGDCDQAGISGAFERDFHFGKMEEGFEDKEVHARVLEQANLLGNVVTRFVERSHAFTFGELRARNAPGHERLVARDFLRELYGGTVDAFGVRAVTRAVEFLARAE